MIPRVARRGHSFKGAGLYYLHDKKALTRERVSWTQTLNLPTNDPEQAMRCMAWTDLHSDELKRESGISTAGRSQNAGSVFAYSLAWHDEQEPDKTEMLKAATQTLARLGLSEHEAVIVAHDDTEHKHIHVIVNLVHPENGTVANIRQDQRTLSAWSSEYERGSGKVYCQEREENATRRERGELTKHQDERLEAAPDLTAMYQQADSGKAFVSALEEAGYTLANGDKGRIVIVDHAGRIQNLVRQIDGAKKKDIEAKLQDVDISTLPFANDIAAPRKAQVQAVPACDAPTPPDTHQQRAQEHNERDELATEQEAAELVESAASQPDYGSYTPNPRHPYSITQHLERAASHMHRIGQWLVEKPREYLESWYKSRKASRGRHHHPPDREPPRKEKKPHHHPEKDHERTMER